MLMICLLAAGLALAGCSGKEDPQEKLIGPWRMAMAEGVHMVLVFRSGGGWVLESSREDVYTRLREKVELAEGQWAFENEGTRLVLTCEKNIPEIGWESGLTPFTIDRMDEAVLAFTSPDGRAYEWQRISATEGGGDNDTTVEEGTVPVFFAPIVVNLQKDELYERYKWLCAKIEVRVAESVAPENIHPKIRERALIFLSAQKYVDVNTQAEVKELETALFDLLNPYFDGKLVSVGFDKFIVTGNEVAVKRFLEEESGGG